MHSTASDGAVTPGEVVRQAGARRLAAIALTDHDTVAGLAEAIAVGEAVGVRVIAGCEFSVAARWGEMHLLAYFLPLGHLELEAFLRDQRSKRAVRAREIVARLNRAGVELTEAEVLRQAESAAVGRPHVARTLIARGVVPSLEDAFTRYIGSGRPAFVPKQLPPVGEVADLVRQVGGVSSAAHLGDRATRATLKELKEAGVTGVEVLHPAHDAPTTARIRELARRLDLLPTGGSDWHGDAAGASQRAPLGALNVPAAWLTAMERRLAR